MKFEILVSDQYRFKFAEISGDNNPLHIDEDYASKTNFKKCILHGAFASGLFSRMAGMYLPGEKCLLTSMKLKFISPIYTPANLIVSAEIKRQNKDYGEVEVKIIDKKTNNLLTEGGYSFTYHYSKETVTEKDTSSETDIKSHKNKILVTGASGGLGQGILKKLGNKGIGVSLSKISNSIRVDSYSELSELKDLKNIQAIVHCAGPNPDNMRLTSLENPNSSIDHNICKPLEDIIALSKLLIKNGNSNASLVIIGSSFSSAGRHNWSMPLYSLSKSLIPNLTKILALELSRFDKKVIGVTYEMLDGGMNSKISNLSKQINSDRMLNGRLGSIEEASMQIKWILDNPNRLISGSLIDCTGGAIP